MWGLKGTYLHHLIFGRRHCHYCPRQDVQITGLVERVNSHVHLHVPAAGALYDAPEDGCILHSKHVEQGKCNKVTLNNLHRAGLNKPIYNDAWKHKN